MDEHLKSEWMKSEWMSELDERQQKEVLFARVYAEDFSHGTDGHNRLLLVNKLAQLLDEHYKNAAKE